MENGTSKAPVLVESEMMVKVNECRVCHGTSEAQRGPILMAWNIGIFPSNYRSFMLVFVAKIPKTVRNILWDRHSKINNQIEIAYLADWFAKQEPKPAIRTIQGDKVLGKKIV